MADSTLSKVPQFGKAEYTSGAQAGFCPLCGQPFGSTFYRINGSPACDACAFRARGAEPSAHSAYARALLFGIGGAIAGMIVYAAFTIMTGLEFGLMSLAAGFLVGKAMKIGSRGAGGTRYQITAVLLTYAAVSVAAVPIALYQMGKSAASHVQDAEVSRPAVSSDEGNPSPAPEVATAPSSEDLPQPARPSAVLAFGSLLLIGLASPFIDLTLDPTHGVIGLIILFVGMRFAWRMTRGTEGRSVEGPFSRAGTAPST